MAMHDESATDTASAPETIRAGEIEVEPGEQVVEQLEAADGATFVLTSDRIAYAGGPADRRRWGIAPLANVEAAEVSTRSRDRGSLIWGVVGLLAAIGVWQVAVTQTVGIVGGVAVAVVSLGLLADYYLRTPDVELLFHAGSAAIGGPVSRRDEDRARAFAARLFAERDRPPQEPDGPPAPPLERPAPRFPCA